MKNNLTSFGSGAIIGSLGGLIGLGGAEFRLPLLNIIFKFNLKDAIVLNLTVSLFTVLFSLLFRLMAMENFEILFESLPIVFNLLLGSMLGSYIGTAMMLKIDEKRLKLLVFFLMLLLALSLLFHSEMKHLNTTLNLPALALFLITIVAGFIIGLVSSLLGVAGGELIIPTIIFIYGVDIKIAGTLSLIVSVPTILISLLKHYKMNKLHIVVQNNSFILYMVFGSIFGAFLGSLAVGLISSYILEVFLAGLLLLSAFKMRYLKKRI